MILAGSDSIVFSNDKGVTWNPASVTLIAPSGSPRPRSGRLASSYFLQEIGWLVYDSGYVLRSKDGGETWEQVAGPTQVWPDNTWPGSFALRFLTTEHGYQVGGDGVLRESYDSGFSWKIVPLNGERVADISCFDSNTCYAITDKARLLRIDSISPMIRR